MTPALAALALVALSQADAGGDAGVPLAPAPEQAVVENATDLPGPAPMRATISADVGVDVLAANVVNTDPGAGTPAELTAVELGLHARAYATAFDERAHIDLDYMGRQPIAGNSQDSAIHLLYKAELAGELLDKQLFIGVGRFLAPSVGLLPVDGVRIAMHLRHLQVQIFGGRRAMTSTDTSNVEFNTLLPAAGASLGVIFPRVQAEVAVTFARDQVPLLLGTQNPSFDALSAYAHATARPFDWLALGGEVSAAQSASYVLGPTWNSVDLTANTVNLFYVFAFLEVRPAKSLRLAYDFHYQRADLFRAGIRQDPNDPTVTAEGFTPQFIDNRVRVRWRPFGLGWIGPEARFRIRPDWQEWRVGGNVDLAPEWAFGLCLRGSFTYEKMVQTGVTLAPADRSFWSASIGWRGRGFDVALGASDVERSALPLSGRVYTPYNDTPDKPVDLSPFVLGAERIAFARVFYGSGFWFGGFDFEQSLTDARERRFFAQLGLRLEKEW